MTLPGHDHQHKQRRGPGKRCCRSPAVAREAATRKPMQRGAMSMIQEMISFVRSQSSFESPRKSEQAPETLGDFLRRIMAAPSTAPMTITLIMLGAEKA
jgi:hypothetical protein